jgi:hypothetical protein
MVYGNAKVRRKNNQYLKTDRRLGEREQGGEGCSEKITHTSLRMAVIARPSPVQGRLRQGEGREEKRARRGVIGRDGSFSRLHVDIKEKKREKRYVDHAIRRESPILLTTGN